MKPTSIDPNPAHGGKRTFRKMTVSVPQEIYERLVRESVRRKIAGEPNQLISNLLREALTKYLDEVEF
jgi:transcriptional regulator of met regulon